MLDPRNNPLDKTNFHLFDPFRTINNNNHLDKSRKQASETYEVDGIKLGLLESELGDESGIHSPPLWKNNHNQIPQSPISRRQAIITGQRELMDMVKNIPESSYELSLKDLVQNQEQYLLKNDEEDYDDDNEEDEEQVVVQVQSNSKKREIKRAYSVDNNNKGLFLKMVFPVGNCSSNNNNNKSKKKNIVMLNSSSSKGLSGNGKTSKSVEKYWWKKRFSVSKSESDSSSRSSSSHSRSNTSGSISSSSSHGSTNSRERTSMLTSCMTCFHSSKNQSAE